MVVFTISAITNPAINGWRVPHDARREIIDRLRHGHHTSVCVLPFIVVY